MTTNDKNSQENLGLDPGRIFTIDELCAKWHRKDRRRLRERLERMGIPVVHIDSTLALVHGRHIEGKCLT